MRKSRNYWNKKNSFEAAVKFNNKRDFKKAHSAAYELLRINDWLDEACSHMNDISHQIKWTFEKCKEEASKYDRKIEFKNGNSWGYAVAKQNGWLDKITSHMIKYKHLTPIQWTKEKCQVEALKYNKRIDFNKNSPKAYAACYRNHWLDEICKHMKNPYESVFKWTKEKCQTIALKYNYRKEFQIGNKNAYSSARYNGWLNDICQHMKHKHLPNSYWNNFDNCKNEALKYKTKTEFIRNSQQTYNFSLKNGWIDEITKHMTPIGDRYNKCIYSYEFSDKHVYVGLTYNIDVREKSRNRSKTDAVVLYKNKSGLLPIRKQLTDYIQVDIAIKLENEYLQKYIIDGWISLNRRKTGGIGSSSPVWNFNRVKKITSKYVNLKSFINNDFELYEIAKRSGWIYSLFPNEI